MLGCIAGDSSGDRVGASCRLRWAQHCRAQFGTFPGPFVANCPPSLALPLRPASKVYELLWTQLLPMKFVRPRAVFFQGLGAGDGNRIHDTQLGKVFDASPLVLLFQHFIPSACRWLGTFSKPHVAIVRGTMRDSRGMRGH